MRVEALDVVWLGSEFPESLLGTWFDFSTPGGKPLRSPELSQSPIWRPAES